MNNPAAYHRQFSGVDRPLLPPSLPTFNAALDLLRNYNYLIETRHDTHSKLLRTAKGDDLETAEIVGASSYKQRPDALLPYSAQHLLQKEPATRLTYLTPDNATGNRKQRSEKRPIPEAQKDDKYFERRRRNNQAAKKSRDARKMREDQIALRATLLEHENAILRAQVLSLREEATSLRQMLMRRNYGLASDAPLCVLTQ